MTLDNAGEYDIYLVKLDPSGDAIWGVSYGDAKIQAPRQVTVAPDNAILLAGPASAAVDFGCGPVGGEPGHPKGFVTILDADGERLYTTIISEEDDPQPYSHQFVERALFNSAGDLVLLGQFHGSVTLGDENFETLGRLDVFVAVFDDVS